MRFNISFSKRLLLLLFLVIAGFCLIGVLSALIFYKFGNESTPAVRIVTVLQDVLVFVLPAVVGAVIATRQPAELLAIDVKPKFKPLLLAICVMIVSMPALNMTIWLNEQLPLPGELGEALKAMEESAAGMIAALQGPHNVPNLIMTILIIAVLAGFSEEMLFRGAFQRLLSTGGMNVHASIWIAAIVFSAMHMQILGFVPRMLLGAFFGYLLVWTRSLWIPIILHALNNSIYLISSWLSSGEESVVDELGAGSDFIIVAVSVLLTAIGLWLTRRAALQDNQAES